MSGINGSSTDVIMMWEEKVCDSGDPRITYISYVSPTAALFTSPLLHTYILSIHTFSHQMHQFNSPRVPEMEKKIENECNSCLPWPLSSRLPSSSQSSSIMASSSTRWSLSAIQPSLITGSLCPKVCESGQARCRFPMSLGRCEESPMGEAGKDRLELS